MGPRRYVALNPADALKQIRAELGPEAVVLYDKFGGSHADLGKQVQDLGAKYLGLGQTVGQRLGHDALVVVQIPEEKQTTGK